MAKRRTLSPTMTEAQFDTGYWYATEIKAFAKRLGIPNFGKLRKDELEVAIKAFLRTGKTQVPTQRTLTRSGMRDTEKGLCLDLSVVNYTNDPETKNFIVAEAKKKVPGLKERSGVRYRLNRWREEQLTQRKQITYRDLVGEYIRLNQSEGRFAQAPSGRYINFLSDFLSSERDATRAQAIAAWKELKSLPIAKNYREWKKHRAKG